MFATHCFAAAAIAVAAACNPAWAMPDVTPAEAAALENQVRDGLATLLGPSARLPDRPLRLTASGDHFDVIVPTGAEALDGSGPARITGTARPATDGSWTIDDVRITTPLRLTYVMPAPATTKTDDRGVRQPGLAVSTIDIQGQNGRITWDPSFTVPSTWTISATGTTIHTEAGPLSQESKIGPSTSVVSLRPVGTDRADMRVEGALQDYTVDSLLNDAPIHIGMQRVGVTSAMNGINRGKAVSLIQALTGMAVTSFGPPGSPPGSAPPKVAPAVIHAVLDALQDVASDLTIDETIDGFAAKVQYQAIGIERLKIGLSGRSENGLLQAGIDMGMDGLVLPDLPLGDMSTLLPRRVALHPVVSGLSVPALTRMANASADGRMPAPEDIRELFNHSGIQLALESMTVDIAGTVFSGLAKMTATGPSPDQLSGTAQITADHFDELMQKLAAMPELTQVMPALVFAKGIGRSLNDRLVWDLSYRDGKLLINNMDLTAMAGAGGRSRPAPGPPARVTPGGTEGGPKAGLPRPSTQKQTPTWGK